MAMSLAIHPRAELLFHRAVAHSHLKNFHRASEFLTRADQAGLGVEVRIGLAEMLRLKYRLKEAEAVVEKILEEHPGNEDAQRTKATIRRMTEP